MKQIDVIPTKLVLRGVAYAIVGVGTGEFLLFLIFVLSRGLPLSLILEYWIMMTELFLIAWSFLSLPASIIGLFLSIIIYRGVKKETLSEKLAVLYGSFGGLILGGLIQLFICSSNLLLSHGYGAQHMVSIIIDSYSGVLLISTIFISVFVGGIVGKRIYKIMKRNIRMV